MISARRLTKSFNGAMAVRDVSFEVAKGETLALLGTSGCGKTTTLKMLNRLVHPDSGEVWIDGKKSSDAPPEILRRGIGYVLQDTGLFPHFTIAQNIAVVPKLLGWDEQKIKARVGELLDKMHLPQAYATAYPNALSGGQQQRVGIARALAASPPVLLMDEPFGALDPVTRAGITKDFKLLDERKNQTIVLVTHDIGEAFNLAENICLMDAGNIVQQGSAQDLLFRPENIFVKTFFDASRMQLEWSAVQLSALISFLPPANEHLELSGFSKNATAWDALQILSNDTANNASKHIDASVLIQAFTDFKKARSA